MGQEPCQFWNLFNVEPHCVLLIRIVKFILTPDQPSAFFCGPANVFAVRRLETNLLNCLCFFICKLESNLMKDNKRKPLVWKEHFTKGKFTKELLTCKNLLQCGSFCWWTSKADVLHVYGTINEIVNFVERHREIEEGGDEVSVAAINIEVIIITHKETH